MSPILQLSASLLAGALLGLGFFWGLWLTLHGLDRAPRPALRLLVSLVLRFGTALAGLYLLTRYGGWPHALAGVFGFTLARLAAVRRLRPRAGGAS